jgi:membrane carboxypeptidase/penicillin-binding protein PbpC
VGASFLPATTITGVAPPDSGVIVIMDPNTGEIRAMVGSANEADYQPGVALYPFVYLTGFITPPPNNFTAASMLLDIPRPFPGSAEGLIYIPNNADGQFRGPISLRGAMGAGLLPPVAQVANIVNLNTAIRRTANPMGVNTMRDGLYDLSLLERGGSVSVLDMTYAYTVFASLGQINGLSVEPASQGFRNHDPVAVKRIEDANGDVLWEYDEAQVVSNRVSQFLQGEVAYIVNDVLADPTTRWETLGRDNVLESQQRAAIVNGITSDHADNWTIGYTPRLVTSVHLGREAGGAMSLNGFAVEGAAPVWRAVMDYVQARDGLSNENWERPPSIVETLVCETSGQSPNGACPTRSEIFLDGGQVPPPDSYWRLVDINTDTNQLATANTPPALRLERPYFIPPDEARDWWVANSRPLPPEDYDLTSLPNTVSSTIILQPSELEIVGGPVDIRGSMNDDNMDFYQVSYGQGTNPNDWFDITQQETQFIPGTSLGTWDTTGKSGIYVLRLNVVRTDGAIDRDFVQVIVDNIAPSVVLTAGEPGQVFTIPESEIIPLSAEVNDNIRIDRVEFYHNGQFVGTDRESPYGYDHTINRAGTEIFTAVVFDAVGNSSSVEISVEVVRSGG